MFKIIFFIFLSPLFALQASEWSLEEKIGQLLMVHFMGEEATAEAKVLIQELHIGGVIYYTWANGLHSKKQVSSLSQQLQALALQEERKIPLLIAIDQEGD